MSVESQKLTVTHKFRAECPLDVAWFILEMNEICMGMNAVEFASGDEDAYCVVVSARMMGRLHWEVHLASNLTIEGIRKAMREVTGGTTMRETLGFADDYTGEL